jgi:hypothetical protein
MVNKATKNKELRIVIADMERRVYDKVKKMAVEQKRTIGKQAEMMLAELIEIKGYK